MLASVMLSRFASEVISTFIPKSLNTPEKRSPIKIGVKSNPNLINILLRICFFEKLMPSAAIIFSLRRLCLRPAFPWLFLENSQRIRKSAIVRKKAIIALFP